MDVMKIIQLLLKSDILSDAQAIWTATDPMERYKAFVKLLADIGPVIISAESTDTPTDTHEALKAVAFNRNIDWEKLVNIATQIAGIVKLFV